MSRYVSSSYVSSIDIYINSPPSVYSIRIRIPYTCTRTLARRRTSEKLVRVYYGVEGIRRRNEGTERRGQLSPRPPYNTVASRIRNLLLIIMLSILTRHSYLVSLSLSSSLSPTLLFSPSTLFVAGFHAAGIEANIDLRWYLIVRFFIDRRTRIDLPAFQLATLFFYSVYALDKGWI